MRMILAFCEAVAEESAVAGCMTTSTASPGEGPPEDGGQAAALRTVGFEFPHFGQTNAVGPNVIETTFCAPPLWLSVTAAQLHTSERKSRTANLSLPLALTFVVVGATISFALAFAFALIVGALPFNRRPASLAIEI